MTYLKFICMLKEQGIDIEKDIDMLTVAFFLTQEECNELLIDLLNLKSLQE